MNNGRVRLNLGSGVGLLGGFVNVDAFFTREQLEEGMRTKAGFCQNAYIEEGAEYVQADILQLEKAFPENHADYVLLNNVLEHFPIRTVQLVADQIYRVLKPGGQVVIMCPDFNGISRMWAETIASQVGKFTDFELYTNWAEVVYGNQVGPGEYHRCPITPDFVNMLLRVAGFPQETIKVFTYPAYFPFAQEMAKYEGIKVVGDNSVFRTATVLAEAVK
jgi:SAM-dependent methyltransferase